MKITKITTKLDAEEIVDKAINGFGATLRTLEEIDLETNGSTLVAYIGGLTISLKIVGFPSEKIEEIDDLIKERFLGMAEEECDCKNCKK